jgi:flagellar protein FliL
MKVVIMSLVAVALLAGGVLAGMTYSPRTPEEVVVLPTFQPLERFVISVRKNDNAGYLIMDITLVTSSETSRGILADAAPLFRNALVERYSNATHELVLTQFEDIQGVQETIRNQFNAVLVRNGLPEIIDQLLLTDVYIQ